MRFPRTGAARRWATVAAGVAVLCSVPSIIAHLPHGQNGVGAGALLAKIQNSTGVGYSGYAESVGGLALPVTSDVNGLDDLLGDRTSMRVWWRGAQDWRVDQINPFGESDVHRDRTGTWTWNYEDRRAVRTSEDTAPAARIPTASDLLPPELGRRLLSQARATDVTRVPVRRIAGVDAPGVRLGTDTQSSIDHVDVYADPATGLPIEVDVYGKGETIAPVTTSFLDLTQKQPAAATTAFSPPAGARTRDGFAFDLVSAANQFSDARAPSTLAGLTQSSLDGKVRAVGVYGRGVTELVAVPLWGRTAHSFSDQLKTAGAASSKACTDTKTCATHTGTKQEETVGPLSLLLLQPDDGQDWAITGTVQAAVLRAAADQLLAAQ